LRPFLSSENKVSYGEIAPATSGRAQDPIHGMILQP
jgi:hypothetical protein